MPILSKEELQKRLNSPSNLINRKDTNIVVEEKAKIEKPRIPLEIRKTIALLSEDESSSALAEAFGISHPSALAISKGETWDGKVDKDLSPITGTVKEKREKAEIMALDSLIKAMGIIPEQIQNRNSKALSSFASSAKTLAEITEKMGGREKNTDNNTVHVHLYAPKQGKVEDYEVIDV